VVLITYSLLLAGTPTTARHVFLCVDMNIDCLDEKAVMTYIACLCDAVHRHPTAAAAAAVTVHQQEVLNYHLL